MSKQIVIREQNTPIIYEKCVSEIERLVSRLLRLNRFLFEMEIEMC